MHAPYQDLSSMKQSPDVDMVCDDFPKGHVQTSWQSLLNIFQALHLRCLPVSVEQHLWNLIVPRCSKKARLGPAVKKRQLLDDKLCNPSPFVPFLSASCVKNALHILVRFKSDLGVGPTRNYQVTMVMLVRQLSPTKRVHKCLQIQNPDTDFDQVTPKR